MLDPPRKAQTSSSLVESASDASEPSDMSLSTSPGSDTSQGRGRRRLCSRTLSSNPYTVQCVDPPSQVDLVFADEEDDNVCPKESHFPPCEIIENGGSCPPRYQYYDNVCNGNSAFEHQTKYKNNVNVNDLGETAARLDDLKLQRPKTQTTKHSHPTKNLYHGRNNNRQKLYSTDSDEEVPKKTNLDTFIPLRKNSPISQKCHLPLTSIVHVTKPCCGTGRPAKPDFKQYSSISEVQHCKHVNRGIKPNDFRERLAAMKRWFTDFNDEQKNLVLKGLLSGCDLPQIHLLSVKMEENFHLGCPPNCQDIITWLPSNIASKIMSSLDPVSLCRASQVCKIWQQHADEPIFWRRFCCQQKWRLSKAAEHKQVISHMSPEGSIQWKKVFAERYRLRNNWLSGRCTVRTFEGHTQGISCVQFDDSRIVSGSSDKTIKVWNIRTNAPWSVQTLVGHSGTVRCLHLDGNRLVSGSSDTTIKVWDLSTQDSWSSIACKVTMIGHTETVRCLQVDDDKVISGSYDMTLKVWDLRTGQSRMTLRGHQAAVLCVHFNETKIVSGSCDKTIKVWNYTGSCLMTLTGHQDAVTCLQFDTTRIVSGSLDYNLKFWDIHSGDCVNTIDWKAAEGHTGVVRCLQADGWRLVSAADDKTIKVWNLETGQRLVTLRNHTDGVTCLQFNDFIIVSGSYDKTVKLWDFSSC
ncbi:hypothetical protein SNE40_014777 [Patella caerulea]|uniref:F-box domain-containing protein n=2 Tax=Patella caerulea TaxID=87958 RepID=A0AAN8JFD2_PATCE